MNSKERDELLARLDERSAATEKKIDSLNEYCMTLDQRVQINSTALAKNKWHDWAIKGSIASIISLFFGALWEMRK